MPPIGEDEAEVLIDIANALGAINVVNALGSVTGGAVAVPPAAQAAVTTVTIGANTTFTVAAPAAVGEKRVVLVTQDGTGSRTGTWTAASGSILWPGGHTSNALSTAAGSVDQVVLESRDGVNFIATLTKALAT